LEKLHNVFPRVTLFSSNLSNVRPKWALIIKWSFYLIMGKKWKERSSSLRQCGKDNRHIVSLSLNNFVIGCWNFWVMALSSHKKHITILEDRKAMLLWNELHVSREINHVLRVNKKLQTHRSYICCKDMEKM